MKASYLLLSIILLLSSCNEKAKKQPEAAAQDFSPLVYIPAEFQFLASVDMDRTMSIPGLSDRLRYEAKRKPSLQIIPIDKIKHLFLSAGSGEETENKGGIYVAVLKEDTKLETVINKYKAKFEDDKDVIITTQEFRDKTIYSIRDKKQKLAICQVKPNIFISGPLDKVVLSLKSADNNISTNESLKELMKINPDDSIKIFLLSSDNIGSILQQLKFFDQLVITAIPTERGGKITLNSICKDPETAEKAKNALLLVQTVLLFKIGAHTEANDLKIDIQGNVTAGTADLNSEALKELFVKD
ncbi:MAG: hypothetical protein NE328_12275 [Lentisphaeraceae bacterium]|nr:hypothetical protein [Lentisphaeraceae bacterium]